MTGVNQLDGAESNRDPVHNGSSRVLFKEDATTLHASDAQDSIGVDVPDRIGVWRKMRRGDHRDRICCKSWCRDDVMHVGQEKKRWLVMMLRFLMGARVVMADPGSKKGRHTRLRLQEGKRDEALSGKEATRFGRTTASARRECCAAVGRPKEGQVLTLRL